MEEFHNSFKQLEAKWEAGLPPELETRVSSQANSFSMFGRVVELFMPNALQTVARLIGGDATGPDMGSIPGRRPAPDEWPDWRTPWLPTNLSAPVPRLNNLFQTTYKQSSFFMLKDFFDRLSEGVFVEILKMFSEAAPKILFALLILLIGWVIARFIRRLIRRVLASLGVDRLAEQLNDIELVQRTGMRVQISGIVASMAYYVLMLGFIVFATDMLGIPAITEMVQDLINYLPALFSAFVLFLLGLFLADMVRGIVLTTCQSMGIPSAKMIASAVFYFLFITIAVSALSQAKISTGFIASNLTVVIGALALAFAIGYGLAARDLVANYLASHYNKNKVRIGDDVSIGGVRGKVVMMDSTSLILQTPERAIIVPMSKMTRENVEVYYPEGQDDHLLPPAV